MVNKSKRKQMSNSDCNNVAHDIITVTKNACGNCQKCSFAETCKFRK